MELRSIYFLNNFSFAHFYINDSVAAFYVLRFDSYESKREIGASISFRCSWRYKVSFYYVRYCPTTLYQFFHRILEIFLKLSTSESICLGYSSFFCHYKDGIRCNSRERWKSPWKGKRTSIIVSEHALSMEFYCLSYLNIIFDRWSAVNCLIISINMIL